MNELQDAEITLPKADSISQTFEVAPGGEFLDLTGAQVTLTIRETPSTPVILRKRNTEAGGSDAEVALSLNSSGVRCLVTCVIEADELPDRGDFRWGLTIRRPTEKFARTYGGIMHLADHA